MQHIHLTNSEVAAIADFNKSADGYRVDYNGGKRRFVLTSTDTGRVVATETDLWAAIHEGLDAELYDIERISPRVRLA